jgi:hypothetical protein
VSGACRHKESAHLDSFYCPIVPLRITPVIGEAHSSLGAGVGIPIIGGISTDITSANAFAMALGGGIDIGLTRHRAIRAVQVDCLRTQFSASAGLSSSLGNRQNSFRYSTGIVFRF